MAKAITLSCASLLQARSCRCPGCKSAEPVWQHYLVLMHPGSCRASHANVSAAGCWCWPMKMLTAVSRHSPANDWDALGQRTAPQELREQDQEGDHDQPKLRAGRDAAAQHARHGLHRHCVQARTGLPAERRSSGDRILARGICHPHAEGYRGPRTAAALQGWFWEYLKPIHCRA